MKICAAHRANVAPSLGFFAGRGSSLASARTPFSENNMNVETKAVGYAIYDAPAKLKAFLAARESGTASKELLAQLSADAMREQEEELKKKPKAELIDFETARRERNEGQS